MRIKPSSSTLSFAFTAAMAASLSLSSPASSWGADAVALQARPDRPLLVREEGKQKIVVKIEIAGNKLASRDPKARPPLNICVVLDRSGSMSGSKIEQAREAALLLVDELADDDVFSLVTYESGVSVLVPAGKIRGKRAEIRQKIREISSAGSTALYQGVETGGEQVGEFFEAKNLNRVILLSDGKANVGPSSNGEIADLGRRLAARGISVTTIGLGAAYNEDLMTALAEASDANYYYVSKVDELPGVFEDELGELKSVVAREIVITIEFASNVRPVRVLGRSENFSGQSGTISFRTLAGEQTRNIYIECEVNSAARKFEDQTVASVTLVYEDALSREKKNQKEEVKISYAESKEKAEKSRDLEVYTEAVIQANADVTREAIRQADSGNAEGFKRLIEGQIDNLKKVQEEAPAAQQAQLSKEIGELETARSQVTSRGLENSSRKLLQQRVWEKTNSKTAR